MLGVVKAKVLRNGREAWAGLPEVSFECYEAPAQRKEFIEKTCMTLWYRCSL
jgi:hypothetical protein